jgi:hypothetical protein
VSSMGSDFSLRSDERERVMQIRRHSGGPSLRMSLASVAAVWTIRCLMGVRLTYSYDGN